MKLSNHYRKQAANHFPEYGAIFMANNSTREECFTRRLFGLPYAFADFVMKVKKGMPLFLFDHQERKLYGVFEASCDGSLNIVPGAYKSAKMKFPAQVHFKVLWRCAPLPECAFHNVIKENYFAPFKFNFGLSRDQVRNLLFLFDERKIKIPRFHMSETRRGRHIMVNSDVANHPGFIENSESLPELTPKELASVAVCNPHNAADLGDYIPLPSVDPEEIEDPLTDDFQWDANSSSLWSFSEVGQSLSKSGLCSSGPQNSNGTDEDEPIDNSCRYQFQGSDADSSKPDCCSSGAQCSHGHENDTEMENSSCHKVHGLYSDREKGISAFLRLAGLPKVTVAKSDRKLETKRDMMNRLDKKHKIWQNAHSGIAPTYNGCKASKTKSGVFSRLGKHVEKVTGSVEREKVSVTEIKSMDEDDKFARTSLKRKSSSTVKACLNAKDGRTENDGEPGKQQKRRLDEKLFIKSSQETKTGNQYSCSVDLCQGSSASTVNNGSSKASLRSNSVIGVGDTAISKEARSVTQPFTCEGDFKKTEVSVAEELKLPHHIQSDASCDEDPVRKLLKQYQEYLSRTGES